MEQLFGNPVVYYGSRVAIGVLAVIFLSGVYRIVQDWRYIKWVPVLGRDTAYLIMERMSDTRHSMTPKQLINHLLEHYGAYNLLGVNLASTLWYLRERQFFSNKGMQISEAGSEHAKDINERDRLTLGEMLLVILNSRTIYTVEEISVEISRRFGNPISQGLLSSQLASMELSGLVEAHIQISPKGLKALNRISKGQRR
jgi:hypothetical protein